VDWSVILRDDLPAPRVLDESVPRSFLALLSTFDEVLALEDPEAILRRAVALARERIGLVRVAIFLLDRRRHLMLGTWGTDLAGDVVDEHEIMYAVSDVDREAFRRAQEEGAHFTVFDGCPIVEHHGGETVIGGRGWVACTPIRSGDATIGMLFNDAGVSGAPVDPAKQAQAAILCSLLGTLLDPIRSRRGLGAIAPEESSGRELTAAVGAALAKDPTRHAKDIAADLGVSLGRLARVFKAEMGMSLVEYRNRLRLDRFTTLLEGGRRSLLDAALEAGFGSYSQFHRVFRALRRATPREYLRRRA
jgi:AraC-like DNA-binding protein